MSDTINILNLFLGPFMASWLPKLHLPPKINILREPKLLVKPMWTNLLTNQIRPLEKTVIQLLSLQKKHHKHYVPTIPLALEL